MLDPICAVEKSPEDSRDWKAEILLPNMPTPKTVDLRRYLPPVRDQGFQGSCVAQAAACMKEWQEHIEIDFKEHMSPQYIYNQRPNKPQEGMNPRDLMKILRKDGVCPESDYPYGSFTNIPEWVHKVARNFRIKGYARIETIEELKTALNVNGVCILSLPVYNFLPRFWEKRLADAPYGGHAVAVVGYNKDGFLIRNSWGTDWASQGYTIFPYEDWGKHWEAWTTIDEKSYVPKPRRSWLQRAVDWVFSIFFTDWPTKW
jgi:hypothetical protein